MSTSTAGFHHVHADTRQIALRHQQPDGYADVQWEDLPERLHADLVAAARLAAVLSPHLTVEEAYLLATYIRGIDPHAILALGPVPIEGEDQRFRSGFVIHAEKCPNRRGVKAVIRHFTGECLSFDEFLQRLPDEPIWGAWITGGYPRAMYDERAAEKFQHVELLVVQDLFSTPLWDRATYQIPGATFAERSGSYVNCAERLQSFAWAIRPPTGAWVEGQLYSRLLGRVGLWNAPKVLHEIAQEISYFAPAGHKVPATGVDLRLRQRGGEASLSQEPVS